MDSKDVRRTLRERALHWPYASADERARIEQEADAKRAASEYARARGIAIDALMGNDEARQSCIDDMRDLDTMHLPPMWNVYAFAFDDSYVLVIQRMDSWEYTLHIASF